MDTGKNSLFIIKFISFLYFIIFNSTLNYNRKASEIATDKAPKWLAKYIINYII